MFVIVIPTNNKLPKSVKRWYYYNLRYIGIISFKFDSNEEIHPVLKCLFVFPVAPYLHDVHLESHPDRLYYDFHRRGWLVNRGTASRCPGHDNYFDLRASSDIGILPTHTGISQKEILQHGPRIRWRSRSDFILQVKE